MKFAEIIGALVFNEQIPALSGRPFYNRSNSCHGMDVGKSLLNIMTVLMVQEKMQNPLEPKNTCIPPVYHLYVLP